MTALPLVALALWRHRRRVGGYWRWPAALLATVVVGASSYACAWWIAGNPLLPLFNGVFASPYFGAQSLVDARWLAGAWAR